MQSVIILGAGTMALEVTDLINDMYGWLIQGYVINTGEDIVELFGKPVYRIEELSKLSQSARKDIKCVRGIYSPACKNFCLRVKELGYDFLTVIHPSASISITSQIHKGVVINRLVAIGSHTIIEPFALINRGVSIGHHNIISSGVTIGPGANISGNVRIGEWSQIGMGANVVENSVIDANAFIKAGSLYKRN